MASQNCFLGNRTAMHGSEKTSACLTFHSRLFPSLPWAGLQGKLWWSRVQVHTLCFWNTFGIQMSGLLVKVKFLLFLLAFKRSKTWRFCSRIFTPRNCWVLGQRVCHAPSPSNDESLTLQSPFYAWFPGVNLPGVPQLYGPNLLPSWQT